MSPIQSRPDFSQPARRNGVLHFAEIAFGFGTEVAIQSWTIAGRSLQFEADRLVRGALASVPVEILLQRLVRGYANGWAELAAIVPAAAEKAAMELSQGRGAPLEPGIGDVDAAPSSDGEIFEIDGKPFAMPARVLDASQGWAMYFIDTGKAQQALGAAAETVSAFDAGGGRTPLMIVGVDYRNSDFGIYPELVVALTVTANGDTARQLFAHYLAIVVTHPFTKEVARVAWGLQKTLSPDLAVRYAADHVEFGLAGGGKGNGKGKAKGLSIRFPRFGDGRSSDQPTFSISRRGEGKDRQTYWAMTTKSGSGEGTQIGGSVVLDLGTPGSESCLCADGRTDLREMLRNFDIAGRWPAANGWTERQTAVYGPARRLNLP